MGRPGAARHWRAFFYFLFFFMLRFFGLLLALFFSASSYALTAVEAQAIAIGEADARIEALNKAVITADDKTAAFLQALADDAVKTAGGKVYIVRDG